MRVIFFVSDVKIIVEMNSMKILISNFKYIPTL